MRYAADLHLHSRHSSAVSPDMTLEKIALQARRKGIDVIGTADCLQPQWLEELSAKLVEREPGWFSLRKEIDDGLVESLPPSLRKPLRFVFCTEVHCAPVGSGRLGGIHHLIYFPSPSHAARLAEKLKRYGDLSEGRPAVNLTSRQLFEMALEIEGCHFAPAHVMNPYFSSLGSEEEHHRLDELFGDLQPHLLAVETGLTSIPTMCRRISSLDTHALFSNSDAHSLENIGREFTILETKPGYEPMIAAIADKSTPRELYKFPLSLTRYFLNWCGHCKEAFDDTSCPRCRQKLITGSRDWLGVIADLSEPAGKPEHFTTLLPLITLLAKAFGLTVKSAKVKSYWERMLQHLGSERYILTMADEDELRRLCLPHIAEAILDQRIVGLRSATVTSKATSPLDEQLTF
jgi:DNA helicase-2/ATP-dependent DNA helicase PcrA